MRHWKRGAGAVLRHGGKLRALYAGDEREECEGYGLGVSAADAGPGAV